MSLTPVPKINDHLQAQFSESWITLSTGYVAIQCISVNKTNHVLHLTVLGPVDSVIRLSNNPDHCEEQIHILGLFCSYWMAEWKMMRSLKSTVVLKVLQPRNS